MRTDVLLLNHYYVWSFPIRICSLGKQFRSNKDIYLAGFLGCDRNLWFYQSLVTTSNRYSVAWKKNIRFRLNDQLNKQSHNILLLLIRAIIFIIGVIFDLTKEPIEKAHRSKKDISFCWYSDIRRYQLIYI